MRLPWGKSREVPLALRIARGLVVSANGARVHSSTNGSQDYVVHPSSADATLQTNDQSSPPIDDDCCTEATLSNRRFCRTENREIAATLGRELWSTDSFVPQYRSGEIGGGARSYADRTIGHRLKLNDDRRQFAYQTIELLESRLELRSDG